MCCCRLYCQCLVTPRYCQKLSCTSLITLPEAQLHVIDHLARGSNACHCAYCHPRSQHLLCSLQPVSVPLLGLLGHNVHAQHQPSRHLCPFCKVKSLVLARSIFVNCGCMNEMQASLCLLSLPAKLVANLSFSVHICRPVTAMLPLHNKHAVTLIITNATLA